MYFSEFLIYIVAPIVACVYLFQKKKFSYFSENDIPHIPPTSWFMGNVAGVGTKYHFIDVLQKVYSECKDKDVIAGLYQMFLPIIIVTDLELLKQITVKDFTNFVDRGVFVNEDEPLTGHLFSIEGDTWRFLRNKLSPAFTSGKIKMMYNTISDKGDSFVKAIEKASEYGSVEMKELSNRFTIDVVSSCAFGMEPNTLKGDHPEFISIFKQIFSGGSAEQFKIMILSLFPNLSKKLKLRMFSQDITEFFNNVIGGTIKYREENNVNRNDFLNMLIQLKNKGSIDGDFSNESRKLTLDECIAQAFIFFFAGADTSSSVISFCMLELGQHLAIQERLRREIEEKTERSNGEISYDILQEMTYLNQVFNGDYYYYSTL